MFPDEGALREARSQRLASGEGEAQRGDMRSKREIGSDRLGDHVGPRRLHPGIDMIAVIAPRPAIKGSVLDRGQIVGDEIVAELITLVDHYPEIPAPGIPGDPDRIAQPAGEDAIGARAGVDHPY